MADQIATNKVESSAAQTELDGLVNIELTLISIIQGVALSFPENSRAVLLIGKFYSGLMPSPGC
jgi:hypothetical protein